MTRDRGLKKKRRVTATYAFKATYIRPLLHAGMRVGLRCASSLVFFLQRVR